jgi:mannose-6-phosphate isomerase-like protein (cupin superfamily)
MKKALPEKYTELRQKSFSYGERNDCAVVALAAATDVPYEVVHKELAAKGRKKGGATFNCWTYELLYQLGFSRADVTKQIFQEVRAKYPQRYQHRTPTVFHITHRFPSAWAHIKGTYLIETRGHILTLKDGEVLDWSVNSSLKITAIYKIEKAV